MSSPASSLALSDPKNLASLFPLNRSGFIHSGDYAAKAPSRTAARQFDVNPKTVLKWRKRATTADAPMGPKKPKSTVLIPAEEAIIVEFRRGTLLPLDDVMGCLKTTSPPLAAAPCIAAFSGTTSPACLKPEPMAQSARHLTKRRSATSTLTAPNSARPRV